MKKTISLLLTLVLCLGLWACQRQQPAETEAPSQTEEKLAPREDFFCLPMEHGRLYLISRDGESPELLWDEACYCCQRQGDQVYAAFDDGTVRRYDGKTGERTVLFTAEKPINQLYALGENDILYCNYSMIDGTELYRWRNGAATQLLDHNFDVYQLNLADGVLVYNVYDPDTGEALVGLDLDTGEERWRAGGGFPALRQDGKVYVNCENAYCRVDGTNGTLTPVEVPCDLQGKDLLHIGTGGELIGDYGYISGTPGVFFADQNGVKKLDILTDEDACNAQVVDVEGDLVLVRSYLSATCPELGENGEPFYYSREVHYLVDTATGSVIKRLDLHSEITAMFADGDFPVLDSSTARKPVTRDLYRTFCLEPDIPGATPVCNTTHGAWLAMADRTSDVALLAAPTEEEQSYLKEKGVEVEMKLYGGDGLVFIGNAACGVQDLTLEQIKAVYRGEITNWAELGGVDAPIRVLYRDDQSGSQRLFERMVWGDDPVPDFYALGFDRLDEMSGIVNECLQDPYSIGYSIMTYLKDVYGEKALLAFSLDGVPAEPRTVADGTYPLGTQGYVVIRADEGENSPARRLYNWFGSPVCDQILTQNGVTPLHE